MATAAIPSLLLVGCGKMGGALLRGWLAGDLAERVLVVEPGDGSIAFSGEPRVSTVASAEALPQALRPTVIVLAVKPQAMAAVLPAYRRFAATKPLFVSIAAGKTLSFFARELGADTPAVRAMPNTPAAIGRGAAVAVANAAVDAPRRAIAERLLAAVGEVAWVDDETLLDAVTAVSGSGPAYVFLLIECLAKAAMAAGLPEALAMRLARATVTGSGELAHRSAEAAAELRRNVTSPGGTTQAALDVLLAKDGLEALLTRAVLAAAKRSRELAN
jgi:pyrroline-5-carboxylate reductase